MPIPVAPGGVSPDSAATGTSTQPVLMPPRAMPASSVTSRMWSSGSVSSRGERGGGGPPRAQRSRCAIAAWAT